MRLQLHDGAPTVLGSKFPLARVWDAAGAQETTIALAHVALGLYGGAYVAPSEGRRVFQVEVYSDADHEDIDLNYSVAVAELAVTNASTFADEEAGAAVRFYFQLHDAATSLFPRMRLYDAAGLVVLTADAVHVSGGLYRAVGVAPASGWYTTQWITYSDSAHSTVSGQYGQVADDFKVGLTAFGTRLFVGGMALRASAPVLKLASR